MNASRRMMIGFLVLGSVVAAPAATSDTPEAMRLQGYLSDASGGSPVPANGTYLMTFDLFDAESDGQFEGRTGPLPVEVVDGFYEVDLEFDATKFEEAERYLEITVEGEVLAPRIRLLSVPFAYRAGMVGEEGLPVVATLVNENETITGSWTFESRIEGSIVGDMHLTYVESAGHCGDGGTLPINATSCNTSADCPAGGACEPWEIEHIAFNGTDVGAWFNYREDVKSCRSFNLRGDTGLGGCGGSRNNPDFYGFNDTWEWTYRVQPDRYWVEHNHNYFPIGGGLLRPYGFLWDTKDQHGAWSWVPFGDFDKGTVRIHGETDDDRRDEVRFGVLNTSRFAPAATFEVYSDIQGQDLDGARTGWIRANYTNDCVGAQGVDCFMRNNSILDLEMNYNLTTPDALFYSVEGLNIDVRVDGFDGAGSDGFELVGVRSRLTGNETDFHRLLGQCVGFDLSADGFDVGGLAASILIESPVPPTTGTVAELDGIRIEDLYHENYDGSAIHIERQTAGWADRGNIRLEGGGFNDGHLEMGDVHLWVHDSTLRMASSPPAGPSSGVGLVKGSGSSSFGPAAWAVGTQDCATSCEGIGQACEGGWDLAAGQALGGCADATDTTKVCFCH